MRHALILSNFVLSMYLSDMLTLRTKELCKERGILLKDLAEQIGISSISLTRINQGQQSPTLETLERLASILCIEVGELFNPKRQEDNFVTCPHCGTRLKITVTEQPTNELDCKTPQHR